MTDRVDLIAAVLEARIDVAAEQMYLRSRGPSLTKAQEREARAAWRKLVESRWTWVEGARAAYAGLAEVIDQALEATEEAAWHARIDRRERDSAWGELP